MIVSMQMKLDVARTQLCDLIICDVILVIDVVALSKALEKFFKLDKESCCFSEESRALGLGEFYHGQAQGSDVFIL
jgi:hypothetical protein